MSALFDFLLFGAGVCILAALLSYAGRVENNTPSTDDFEQEDDL